jgi:hypothetical protein
MTEVASMSETTTTSTDVCEALDIAPEDLADIFRRAARYELRVLAEEAVSDIQPRAISMERATHMLMLAEAFENEYERLRETRGGADATQSDRTKGGSHSPDEVSTAAQEKA